MSSKRSGAYRPAKVDFAAIDLAAVEKRVGPADLVWEPNIDWIANRVTIDLPFVTEETILRVGDDRGAVIFRPLAVKAEP